MNEKQLSLQAFRFANQLDIPQLKTIWQLCFGDDQEYIDFYFKERYKEGETVLLTEENEIAAMLTMIPSTLVTKNNVSYRAAMLYAIATHPDFQNRGLAGKLMNHSSNLLKENKVDLSVLVPATSSLYDFYENRGYVRAFYLRETVLEVAEIYRRFQEEEGLRIKEIDGETYNHRRKEYLKGNFYLSYGEEEVVYQEKVSKLTGGGIYSVDHNGAEGCFIAERVDNNRVIIKEILVKEEQLGSVLKKISSLLPAHKYLIRSPAFLGNSLGGTVRPFAMIKAEGPEGDPIVKELLLQREAYLGIALD